MVKAPDSKSGGLCPRGFESLCCRVSYDYNLTTITIYITTVVAWMAEWSKAADLSSVIFGCVGSNPTSGIFFFFSFQNFLDMYAHSLYFYSKYKIIVYNLLPM